MSLFVFHVVNRRYEMGNSPDLSLDELSLKKFACNDEVTKVRWTSRSEAQFKGFFCRHGSPCAEASPSTPLRKLLGQAWASLFYLSNFSITGTRTIMWP